MAFVASQHARCTRDEGVLHALIRGVVFVYSLAWSGKGCDPRADQEHYGPAERILPFRVPFHSDESCQPARMVGLDLQGHAACSAMMTTMATRSVVLQDSVPIGLRSASYQARNNLRKLIKSD
eukprot:3740090-Amphidinium_carterae.1